MSELRETAFDHVGGEDFATFFTAERKWINHILSLKEQYPDEVDIRHVNDDGSLLAHIPAAWLKIRPKKKVNMTAEQIAASKARLEKGRLKRLNAAQATAGLDGKSDMNGDDDAHVAKGKETI